MVLPQRGWTWVLIECYPTQHFPRSRRFLLLRSPVQEHHPLSSITKSILSESISSDRFHNKALSVLTSLLKTFPCFNLGASLYFAHDEYIQTNVEHNFEVPRKGFAFTALTTKEQTAITLACTTRYWGAHWRFWRNARETRGMRKIYFFLFFSPRVSRACVAHETLYRLLCRLP